MSEIFCVVDGMTDPLFKTESLPNMSSFPEKSLVQTTPKSAEPESFSCIMRLLGVDDPPSGARAWIEALGAGMRLDGSETVFRGTWVLTDKNGICLGYAHDEPEGFSLPDPFRYKSLGGGKALAAAPLKTESRFAPLPYKSFGKQALRFLGQCPGLSEKSLVRGGKALLLWAPSTRAKLAPPARKGAAVCAAAVAKGIAAALGMPLFASPSMTGDVDTSLDDKADAALKAAESFPFVFLHLGGADEASHRRDKESKRRFLEDLDSVVLGALLRSRHTIVCASDHGCDPATGKHTRALQPLLRRAGRG
jgi:2,3-bisphosphoglycerate-independent phosphoglycerate mutase